MRPLASIPLVAAGSVLAGCAVAPRSGEPRATSSDIRVAYYAQVPAFVDPSPLRVRIVSAAGAADVRGSELTPLEGGPWLESRPIPVAESGALEMTLSWIGAAGDTLARHVGRIPGLAPGYQYGVSIYAGGRNPAASGPSICGGPPAAVAIPRPGAAAESLYVHLGGIPRGAVC